MTMAVMRQLTAFLMIVILMQFQNAVTCYKQGWFDFHLLINPGLVTSNATTRDGCFSLCQSAGTCSALSYNPSTQVCVWSQCAILHFVKNNGWNSYIFFSYPVESVDYSAPIYEWIFTDACTLQSTGTVPDVPSMWFNSAAAYLPSQSIYIGNATTVAYSNDGNYLRTDAIAFGDYVNYFTSGFTGSGWFYMNSVKDGPFFEFGYWSGSTWGYGTQFWYTSAYGLLGRLIDNVDIKNNIAFTMPTNTWTHYAMTYDPANRLISFYVNGTAYAVFPVTGTLPTSHANGWSRVAFGKRPKSTGFDGKYYCFRYHLSPLSAADIQANAIACNGRIRIS